VTAADRPGDESDPRSYARSYERVAPSTSTSPLEGVATATKRWTRAETKAHVSEAAEFRYASPDESLLCQLVAGYEEITKDPVRTPAKRNLVATCYRTHGDQFLSIVAEVFDERGTATNLLGIVRTTPPVETGASEPPEIESDVDPVLDEASATADLLPGVTYGEHNRPRFDPTSTQRYDRRPSNPSAAAFFSDQELGVSPVPSPTARAIGR
jgi:hypothetical protein